MNIERPTAILNTAVAKRNIKRMAEKARRSDVRFRPHFKTHQSATIGEWFRAEGVSAITVSSLDMAEYFAENGWDDITVAFPVNWLQIKLIKRLAERIRLNLLVESAESVEFLDQNLPSPVNIWLKVDTGYRRTGLAWSDSVSILEVAQAIQASKRLKLVGLLTHAGHSYAAKTDAAIRSVYDETVERLGYVRAHLAGEGIDGLEISIGDTPTCSIVDDFSAVDEIRPGAFVFYDWMQVEIGACKPEDIAVAVACPVVARQTERGIFVIYGGAVHLSKDHTTLATGETSYGMIALPHAGGWGEAIPNTYVRSLSQEHGIVQTDAAFMEQIKVGDVIMVLPAHTCLTCNLLKRYQTLDGDMITMMGG